MSTAQLADTDDGFVNDDEDDFVLPRKKRADEEMDITPMIDITFLLLIFFVVCSTMDPSKMNRIPEATRGVAIADDESAVIIIEPNGKDSVIVKRFGGAEFSRDEDAQVSEIVSYVTEEMERSLGKAKKHVMIFADQDVPVLHVTRIQTIIGDAFEDIESTYIAVKEQ